MSSSRVFLWELEELDAEERVILTGRFEGYVEGPDGAQTGIADVPFDTALEWAQRSAGLACLDAEGRRWSIGRDPDHELPRLTDETVTRLRSERRRPLGDEWLDRSQEDRSIEWEIVIELTPDELARSARPRQAVVADAVVEALRRAGFERLRWSAAGLDAGLDDIERQQKQAGGAEFGWTTCHSLAIEITGGTSAPAHRPVVAALTEVVREAIVAATGRMPWEAGAEDLSGRWGLELDVHPPGYEPPPHPV